VSVQAPEIRQHENAPPRATRDPFIRRFLRTIDASFVLTFLFSLITWLVLSGKFDRFHLTLGVVSCLIVAYTGGHLLLPPGRNIHLPGVWLRFLAYLPWLLWQVFLANLHVMYLVFHPRMKELIDPRIIRFKSRLKKDMSLMIFANSITLTPGTITLYVSIWGDYTVHLIDEQSGRGLPGAMEARVGRIFGE